jgi:hypothetical protein
MQKCNGFDKPQGAQAFWDQSLLIYRLLRLQEREPTSPPEKESPERVSSRATPAVQQREGVNRVIRFDLGRSL